MSQIEFQSPPESILFYILREKMRLQKCKCTAIIGLGTPNQEMLRFRVDTCLSGQQTISKDQGGGIPAALYRRQPSCSR